MTTSDKFCFKWDDLYSNISTSFKELREEQDFTDVTLAFENNKKIEGHKFIL